jgi:tape measure domain-containing protein
MEEQGKIWYGVGIDNSQLKNDADESRRLLRSIGNEGENAGKAIDAALGRVGKTIAATFSVKALSDFTRNIIKVRSEIESLEISFNTLLGNKEKAAEMLGEIREFAVKTPMMISDLAKSAKTLLSFNVAAEKVMPTLKAIGDISMGDAGKFQSLTLAFAQMSSTGKLMGQDLLQMINAGFNPLAEISERTGKSIADLKEEMSKGAISAEMVTQAFIDATSEGGKFNGMLEEQSKGLTGSISNLKGAFDDMLNDLGEKMQDSVSGVVQHTTDIVRNYEKIGDALAVLIAGYGSYKAAVIATNLVMKASTFADNIRLVMMFRKELGLLRAAQQAFNLSAMSNPYIFMASAIVAATVAIAKLVKHKREEEQAIIDSTKEMRHEYTQTNMLIGKLKDANLQEEERKKILEQLRQVNPDIVKDIDDEATAFEKLNERLEDYNKKQLAAIAVKQFSKREDFDDAVEDLIDARDKMESANADMVDLWSSIYDRYLGLLEKGDEIPESIKSMMDSLIESEASEAEKVESVFSAWRQIEDRIKQSHGAYSGISEGRYTFDALLGGLSDREYRKTAEKLDKIEGVYKEKAEVLKAKIEQIALSVYTTDEAARQQFIDSQMAIYFPESNKQTPPPPVENQEEKRNKAYWEAFKKKKEDELAALTDAELATQKAAEIRKQIAQAERKIAAYSVSYKDNGRLADETAERRAKMEDYVQARIKEEQAAEFEIRQAAINAQKEGFDRQIKQAQLDYDRLIAANEERQRQMVERMRDEKLNEWMIAHPKANKEQQLAFRASITYDDLTDSQKAMLAEYGRLAENALAQANKKALDEMLADYQTYDQKRLRMEMEFGNTSKAIAKGLADERAKLLDKAFSSYVNITADGSEAQKEISELLEKWKEEVVSIGIDADEESISDLKERLEEIRDKSIELGVDTSGVDFGKLLESLELIQGKPVEVEIDVDDQDAVNRIHTILSQLEIFQHTKFRAELEVDLDEIDDTAYANVEERMAAINKAYDSYIGKLRKAGASEAEINSALAEQVNAAGELATLYAKQAEIEEAISHAIQKGEDGTDTYKELLKTLTEIIKQIQDIEKRTKDATKPARTLADIWKEGLERSKEYLENLDYSKIADDLGELASKIKDVGIAAGKSDLSNFAEGLEEISSLAGTVIQGFESGGWIGALINAVGWVASNLLELAAQDEAVGKAVENSYLATALKKINDMMQSVTESDKWGAFFGSDSLGDFNSTLSALTEIKDNIRLLNMSDNLRDYANLKKYPQIHAANIDPSDRMMTFNDVGAFWNWFGIEDDVASLTELVEKMGYNADDLYDKYGNLDAEVLQQILDTYTELNDEDRAWIEAAIELSNQYADAMQQIADYMSGIFGQIADSLADQMIDAFIESGQAAVDFGNVVSDVAKKMAKDLIKNLMYDRVFKALEESIMYTIDTEYGGVLDADSAAAVLLLVQEALGKIDEEIPYYQQILESLAPYFEDPRVGDTATGIAQASQDSVDELNGRMTAVQSHTYSISENTILIQQNTANIMQSVMHIEQDINEMGSRINNMETMTTQMRNTLDDFRLNGIRIR